jgi:UDP-N-acetylmuramoyl-L-alanyl-D-glutamate--2,6-diaminopimelate ligase
MQLSRLFPEWTGSPDPQIRNLTADSREVRPGSLFAALPGDRDDGRRFVGDALSRGAVAVLSTPGLEVDVPVIEHQHPRTRLALAAAEFHGPGPATMTAVTGTNGKSSIVHFTAQIWRALGHPAASMGTLGVDLGGRIEPLIHTTPEPVTLHKVLAGLRRRGFAHAALEASSHGLAQARLDACVFAAAALTDVTRDHYDYHGGYEAYLAAKMKLFAERLSPRGTAVLDLDAKAFEAARRVCAERGLRVLTYGGEGADLALMGHDLNRQGQGLKVRFDGVSHRVQLPILGPYQGRNALAAAGLVLACGAPAAEVFDALNTLTAPRGRMEFAGRTEEGGHVFVDYAHSPDSLEAALTGLRRHGFEHVRVVFGCGGERDRAKRPEMGAVAERRADRVLVTDDNPRSEDPAGIRREILGGTDGAEEWPQRRAAIRAGIAHLGEGQALLIAGKGHETGQIVNGESLPFDDVSEARNAIGGEGAP